MDRQSGNKSVVFNHLCYQRFIAGWWLEWSGGTLQFALDFHFVRTWQNLVYKSPIKDSCQSNFNMIGFFLHRKQILVSTNFLIFIKECFLFYKTVRLKSNQIYLERVWFTLFKGYAAVFYFGGGGRDDFYTHNWSLWTMQIVVQLWTWPNQSRMDRGSYVNKALLSVWSDPHQANISVLPFQSVYNEKEKKNHASPLRMFLLLK